MPIRQSYESVHVPVRIWTEDVAPNAVEQLRRTAALPFVFRHVAAMADVHVGIGATVGSVVATRGAICPAAVGVDIGCGMAAVETVFEAGRLDGKLPALRAAIERRIPVGQGEHRSASAPAAAFLRAHPVPELVADLAPKAARQIGSLGGGNHFVEVCLDERDRVWLMLHSGSRGVGNRLASRHIETAKEEMKRMFVRLPDPDLAYFATGTTEFETYWRDLRWAQEYARVNREAMLAALREAVRETLGAEPLAPDARPVNCHHNYVAEEVHFGEEVLVTRKGAIRAGRGELGIIPGSMGTASYIVSGLGNAEAFESAPHGAGRRFSRGEARRRFTVADVARETSGVECRKDSGILDEIPSAYKPIDEVMANSSDLVEIVARLKQVLCVKG